MSRFFSKEYQSLKAYVPGEQPKKGQRFIKLNTNESPYPPSPKVIQALGHKEVESLRLYPDPKGTVLVDVIATYYGISNDKVILGNGSDEILAFVFMAFQNEKKKFYFPEISYGFYPVYGQVFGADWKTIPLKKDFSIDPKDYYRLDGTIVIANPNAPTGLCLSLEEISGILRENPDNLVVIDEAYVDFGGESAVSLIKDFDNLLVVQTMSKSRSLAGGRVGFALGQKDLIEDLDKIKYSFNPYNINGLSLLAGRAAIEDAEYFQSCRNEIIKTRERVTGELEAMDFQVLPSKANFIFVRPPYSAETYVSYLRENGILVRYFPTEKLKDYVRITIGSPEEMDTLLEITKAGKEVLL